MSHVLSVHQHLRVVNTPSRSPPKRTATFFFFFFFSLVLSRSLVCPSFDFSRGRTHEASAPTGPGNATSVFGRCIDPCFFRRVRGKDLGPPFPSQHRRKTRRPGPSLGASAAVCLSVHRRKCRVKCKLQIRTVREQTGFLQYGHALLRSAGNWTCYGSLRAPRLVFSRFISEAVQLEDDASELDIYGIIKW